MWLKVFLLLLYICLLFLLSRLLETISWCDPGHSGVLSRQFLDPMLQSVVKLKSLLDHRGVSYDGVVEKSELTSLVEVSGPVTAEEMQVCSTEEENIQETNFTSGAHFIEQVEDAKDSVWLVQVIMHSESPRLFGNRHWNNIQRKASRFGVRTGLLDCSLDVRYCSWRNWKGSVLILALPSHFEKKASVTMYNYSGPSKESSILQWIRDKIDARVFRIKDEEDFQRTWQDLSNNWLNPEIQAVLFTQSTSAPLFFSALSVKFPGRVKFSRIQVNPEGMSYTTWKEILGRRKESQLPAYVIYSAEGNYTYGSRSGEHYSFTCMELFFKFLYPCLNDIFITSFCVANVLSWLEFFILNCGICRRIRKLMWCIFKYNMMVILLWLPIIGLFQMPYLDHAPLFFLKLNRMFMTSNLGSILRGDFVFFLNNPIYMYVTFVLYFVLITVLCKKYRAVEEADENWFNFSQMQTLAYLRPNNLFEPVRISGGLQILGSRLSQPSLWLQPSIPLEYIQHLPTWRYTPPPFAARVHQNIKKMESAIAAATDENHRFDHLVGEATLCSVNNNEIPYENHTAETDVDDVVNTCPGCSLKCYNSVGRTVHPPSQSSELTTHTAEQSPLPAPSALNQPGSFACAQSDSSCHCLSKVDTPLADASETDVTSINVMQDNASVSPQSRCFLYGFPKGYIESHQCVICLDEYVPNTMLCGLPCGHVFHEHCIISWLNLEKHFCPMCRWPSFKPQSPPQNQ